LGPWQGDPRGRIPQRTGPHSATGCGRWSSVLRTRGAGAAGGASRPWERAGRGRRVGRGRGGRQLARRGSWPVRRTGRRAGGEKTGEPKARARPPQGARAGAPCGVVLSPGLAAGDALGRAPSAQLARRGRGSTRGLGRRVCVLASSLGAVDLAQGGPGPRTWMAAAWLASWRKDPSQLPGYNIYLGSTYIYIPC
jgi:hypothetical protein